MKINFTKDNGPIDEIIEQLMEAAEDIRNPEFVREMIITSLKAGQEADAVSYTHLTLPTNREV